MTDPKTATKEKVYAGLVYMGDERGEYEKIVKKKYGKNAELRNFTFDDIHQHRAELFTTPEIFEKEFGGKAKLIS